LDDAAYAAMTDWRNSPLFDAEDRLVLELAEAVARNDQVDDERYARLEQTFSSAALVRLTMTIALAGMVNRIHAMFHTDVDSATLGQLS
jgi:alkylhydroperoxidase family enzyme